jgi:uncharacterized delta-60 repeat protein
VLEPDGQIVAGGDFLEYNGANVPDWLIRLNANGSRAASFNGTNLGFNSVVRTLALEPDGQVLAGGYFGSYNNVNGPSYLTRLNPDGSRANEAFIPPGVTYTWSNGATGPTLSVTQPGLYQAMATSGGCVAYSNVVRVDATPVVMVQLMPVGPISLPVGGSQVLTAAATLPAFNPGGTGFSSGVRAIVVQLDGRIVVGGFFTTYNGLDVPDNLVRLMPDGSVDPSFNPGGSGLDGQGVLTLALEVDGQILVGGDFFNYNGINVPNRLLRLSPDGSRNLGFNPGGSGFDLSVSALLVQPDGRILAGGSFTTYNGANVPDCLLRLLPNGTLDSSFMASSNGLNLSVLALGLEADGQVVVGGRFTAYNGDLAAPDCLLRLNSDGSWDHSYNAGGSGLDERVYALLVLPDGKVLAGGGRRHGLGWRSKCSGCAGRRAGVGGKL